LKKFTLFTISLLALSVILISWGATGHSKISESSALSFNQQMQGFQTWIGFLRDHASDADYRKATDPTEGPKHYIDIDNYDSFVSSGRIPQTLDSVVSIYGANFVEDNGILPWATLTSFDSLRNCLQRLDFDNAKIYAADLGHYVADGHMPLHITKNYNGQLTGNTGIHSRYESTMINAYIAQFTYPGQDATEILNVNQYVFDYLYGNYSYCDSILAADNYAKSQSSNYSSSTYKNALWSKSRSFTIPLFERASHALASLLYTAWIQAGSPTLVPTGTDENLTISNAVLQQNKPNPFRSSTQISYTIKETSKVLLQVHDINGNIVDTLVNSTLNSGDYSCNWTPAHCSTGIYYLVLHSGKFIQAKKMVYSGQF